MNIWIQRAEIFDSWRVVPRVVLFGYCGFAGYLINLVVTWYIHLPLAQQTIQNASFPTAVSAILTGLGVPVFNIYSQNGRDWNAHPDSTVPPP